MTETEVKVDAATLPIEKKEKPDQKPRSPRGGRKGDREGIDEAALEREFKNFAIKLRKQFGEDCLAYQVSNYPEGLEFSVRVAKKSGGEGARFTRSFASNPAGKKQTEKKERKELTEEQKAKKAEKQAKRREYFEKKRQERLENGVKEEESGKDSAANGESAKQSQ